MIIWLISFNLQPAQCQKYQVVPRALIIVSVRICFEYHWICIIHSTWRCKNIYILLLKAVFPTKKKFTGTLKRTSFKQIHILKTQNKMRKEKQMTINCAAFIRKTYVVLNIKMMRFSAKQSISFQNVWRLAHPLFKYTIQISNRLWLSRDADDHIILCDRLVPLRHGKRDSAIKNR